MYSPHIAKERSYSCLLQLSNIMPLKTAPCAPSVQYPLSETCSYVSKCPAGISYLRTLVYQTSEALLDPQCQVLRNFHLTEVAIHAHCILFPTFYDLKSIQIIICIYPGKKHSWLEKGSTEWFTVVNSYPTEERDYQIQQSNFHFHFPSNDGDRINYSNSGNLAKTFTHWQLDYSNQMTVFKSWHLNHCTKYNYLINVNKIVTKNK